MDFTQQDLMNIVNKDRLMGNTTMSEQTGFISEQIKNPFDSGNTNYFRKLRKLAVSDDQLDNICSTLFREIEDVYPGLEFDFGGCDDNHLGKSFEACYKFFVKNISKLMYIFLKEYIFNNKNRKGLIADHSSSKITSYPKEQYGKKEYYILITKLNQIVRSIADDNVRLYKFIEYIERSEETPMYMDTVKKLLDTGMIVDHNIVENIFDLFERSDARHGIMNKLEMEITKSLIIPCLEENGLIDLRITANIIADDDVDDSDDDEDTEND